MQSVRFHNCEQLIIRYEHMFQVLRIQTPDNEAKNEIYKFRKHIPYHIENFKNILKLKKLLK